MDNQSTVSVIICAYTEERLNDIKEAVNSVVNQSVLPDEITIVVDNNEVLYHLLIKEYFGKNIRIIHHQGQQGSASARNYGALNTTGKIIVFLDDDAIADKDWLYNLLGNFNEKVIAVGGKAIPKWAKERPIWLPEELDWIIGGTYKGYRETQGVVRNVHIHNMAIKRHIFLQGGMLRTDNKGGGGMIGNTSRGGEEAELCLRLQSKFPANEVIYDPTAIIYHKVHSSKMTLIRVTKRAFGEGKYKAWVENSTVSRHTILKSEHQYLKYLMCYSIPSRLVHIFTIIICIISVILGYVIGKFHFSSLRNNIDRPIDKNSTKK